MITVYDDVVCIMKAQFCPIALPFGEPIVRAWHHCGVSNTTQLFGKRTDDDSPLDRIHIATRDFSTSDQLNYYCQVYDGYSLSRHLLIAF